MTNEELNNNDKFLLQNGKRVYEAREIKAGDILGTTSSKSKHVKLSYVERVHLEPSFLKFDYFPYAKLKGPAFNLTISDNLEPVGFKSLYLNPEEQVGRLWRPEIISQDLSPDRQKDVREFIKEFSSENEIPRAYIINDGPYKDLGDLIPLVELPSLYFLPQSRNLEELIERVKSSKDEMENLRRVSKNLKKTFECN